MDLYLLHIPDNKREETFKWLAQELERTMPNKVKCIKDKKTTTLASYPRSENQRKHNIPGSPAPSASAVATAPRPVSNAAAHCCHRFETRCLTPWHDVLEALHTSLYRAPTTHGVKQSAPRPSSPAWTKVCGLEHATQIGGFGFENGFGNTLRQGMEKY